MNTNILWNRVLFILRVLLGVTMIYFGVSKIGASPEKVAFVGGAGIKMGLEFLNVNTWFWIAVIGEILGGLLLLLGGKGTKIGALLTLSIMMFAGNATQWNLGDLMFVFTTIIALLVLFYGNGYWFHGIYDTDTKTSIDLGKITGVDTVVDTGTQLFNSIENKVSNVADLTSSKDKTTDILGSAGELAKGPKDFITDNKIIQDIACKASDLVEGVEDHTETIGSVVESSEKKVKDVANTTTQYVPTEDTMVDKLKDVVKTI